MNIFRRLRNGFARFMYGRNGLDQLGLTTVWMSLICDLLAVFVDKLWFLYYIALALWAVALFRMFSRNVYKRQAENARWMNLWSGLRNRWTGAKARHADKEHKYFTCKNCKTICRVPAGKGKIVVTCPKCGMEMQVKS